MSRTTFLLGLAAGAGSTYIEVFRGSGCTGRATIVELSNHTEPRCEKCWDRCHAGFELDSSYRVRGPGMVLPAQDCIGQKWYKNTKFLPTATQAMGCLPFKTASVFVLCSFGASIERHHDERFSAACEKALRLPLEKKLQRAKKELSTMEKELRQVNLEKSMMQTALHDSASELEGMETELTRQALTRASERQALLGTAVLILVTYGLMHNPAKHMQKKLVPEEKHEHPLNDEGEPWELIGEPAEEAS